MMKKIQQHYFAIHSIQEKKWDVSFVANSIRRLDGALLVGRWVVGASLLGCDLRMNQNSVLLLPWFFFSYIKLKKDFFFFVHSKTSCAMRFKSVQLQAHDDVVDDDFLQENAIKNIIICIRKSWLQEYEKKEIHMIHIECAVNWEGTCSILKMHT